MNICDILIIMENLRKGYCSGVYMNFEKHVATNDKNFYANFD